MRPYCDTQTDQTWILQPFLAVTQTFRIENILARFLDNAKLYLYMTDLDLNIFESFKDFKFILISYLEKVRKSPVGYSITENKQVKSSDVA